MGDEQRGFPVTVRRGHPADLVAPPRPDGRLAVFCEPDRPAVVLGSTQDAASIDHRAVAELGGVEVRRRSGGGAVYVEPGSQVWLDLFVPAGNSRFDPDVSRASGFVAQAWREALQPLIEEELSIHSGALVSSSWSRRWCFSGLGPGELTIGGKKVVGLSQRRNRDGAWFFTMARIRADSDRDASLIVLDGAERSELAKELARTTAVLSLDASTITAALRAVLAAI